MQNFGPLAPFMEDPEVTEIVVEGVDATVVTKDGNKSVGALWPGGLSSGQSSPALFRFVERLVHESGWTLPFAYMDRIDNQDEMRCVTAVNCNVEGGLLFAAAPPAAPYGLHIWKGRRWPTFDVDAMASRPRRHRAVWPRDQGLITGHTRPSFAFRQGKLTGCRRYSGAVMLRGNRSGCPARSSLARP